LTGTTVNFHLKNATMKLDAANKTQAAIKAVTLGILL
jgi:DNA-binding CsgD family transcriptional regulator